MALIAVAADKGSPGVTTAAIALAAVWPRPVLLAECDPAGGDLVYRLPGADGEQLDPRRGLLSLAVAARRGLQPHQVWEHTQRLYGGLDVLTGVTNAEQGSGLNMLWASLGTVLGALPQADVIADCGRIGADGPHYDLLAQAATVVMITRASFGEVVRLRDRAGAIVTGVQRRGRPGARIGVVVIAQHKRFDSTLAEVHKVLDHGTGPASIIGGLAFEPKSADQLSGQWGGKLDRSMLIRTTREIAEQLAGQLPDLAGPGLAPAPVPPPAQPVPPPAQPVVPPEVPPAAQPVVLPPARPAQEIMHPARPQPAHEPSRQPDPLLPPLPPQPLPPRRPAAAPPGRRGRHAEPPARSAGRTERPRSEYTDLPSAGPAAPAREAYLSAPPARLADPVRSGYDGFPPAVPAEFQGDGRGALPGRLADPVRSGYEGFPPAIPAEFPRDDRPAAPPASPADVPRNGHADRPAGPLPAPPGPPGQDVGW